MAAVLLLQMENMEMQIDASVVGGVVPLYGHTGAVFPHGQQHLTYISTDRRRWRRYLSK